MLVYKLSGLPMMISDEMVEMYKKGTKPEHNVTQSEIDEIKNLLFSTLEKTKQDFANNVFHNFLEFTTMTGFTIQSAQSAMEFNNYHEALHTGIMMRIQKLV
jgi:hypothetical protein